MVASHAATPAKTIAYDAVQGILDALVQGELEDGSAIRSLFDQNLKVVEKLARRRPIDTECILATKAAKIAVLITECADIMDTFTSGEAFFSNGPGGSSASWAPSAVQEQTLAAPGAGALVSVRPALLLRWGLTMRSSTSRA